MGNLPFDSRVAIPTEVTTRARRARKAIDALPIKKQREPIPVRVTWPDGKDFYDCKAYINAKGIYVAGGLRNKPNREEQPVYDACHVLMQLQYIYSWTLAIHKWTLDERGGEPMTMSTDSMKRYIKARCRANDAHRWWDPEFLRSKVPTLTPGRAARAARLMGYPDLP